MHTYKVLTASANTCFDRKLFKLVAKRYCEVVIAQINGGRKTEFKRVVIPRFNLVV